MFKELRCLLAMFACANSTIYAQTANAESREAECDSISSFADNPIKNCDPKRKIDVRLRTPAMIGDFYTSSLGISGSSIQDSLIVLADDLDAPNALPPGSSLLSIAESGPVGIFSSSLQSAQQLQFLLRNGGAIPGGNLVSVFNNSASLTTSSTISQIQAQLANTGQPFDIIAIQHPPGSYDSAVNAAFIARNGGNGAMSYNATASGAFLQGGADTLNGGEDLDAYYFYDYVVRFDTSLADATSGGLGRMKIAEGGTILPQDRFFFRYNYLDNVRYSNGGQHLNRYVPGFERSFFNQLMSVELRAPFASNTTSASTFSGSTFSNSNDTRFGNLSLYLKALLWDTGDLAISGGLGFILPTAKDIEVDYANGTPLLNVANQSAHLQPFLGALYTPTERIYFQSFIQWDGPISGNDVSLNLGNGLQKVGSLNDANTLFVDAGIGYWLYRSNDSQGLTAVIPTFEVHQNNGLQTGDIVTGGGFQIGDFRGTTNLTNLVAGSTFQFGRSTQVTAAYLAPVGGGADRQFNGGLQMFVSRLMY